MSSGKKVLLFIDNLGAGGAQRQMSYLACLLKEKGYDTKVITYGDCSFYAPMFKDSNVVVEEVEGAASHLWRIPKIKQAIDKFNPECVIAYLDTPCIIASLIKLVFRKRWRLIVSERNTTQKLTKKGHLKFWLYGVADAIVPNSFSQSNFIKSHYPKLSAKTTPIVNFVDTEKFRPAVSPKSEGPVKIMVAATIWPPKNTIGLILAINSVVKKGYTNFSVRWYGAMGYEYENECLRKIEELGLSDYISLLPKSQNIAEKYQEADWFCLPSFYEGTPNVICEAMASGLPIVCSNVCDNACYVEDGKNGYLFDPNSIEDIAETIIKTVQTPAESRSHMGKRSREVAEAKLSTARFINEYIKVIDEN